GTWCSDVIVERMRDRLDLEAERSVELHLEDMAGGVIPVAVEALVPLRSPGISGRGNGGEPGVLKLGAHILHPGCVIRWIERECVPNRVLHLREGLRHRGV